MKYIVIKHSNYEAFLDDVNRYITEQGYKPCGGISVVVIPESFNGKEYLMYYQPLVKE